MDASALSGMVDDIDEVGIIRLFDGGRYGEATHAEGADIGGNYGGTDGAVRGHGVGFDVDGGFHGDRFNALAPHGGCAEWVLSFSQERLWKLSSRSRGSHQSKGR